MNPFPMPPKTFLSALVLFAPVASAQAPDLFRAHDYRAGLEAAQAEEKPLFVQFYATWDVESQRLDETLWQTASVVSWLEEHTVPIRIDWDRSKELAREFEVINVYAVSIFVAPDGRELDRIIHMQSLEAEEFLAASQRIVAGDTPVQEAWASLSEAPDDPVRLAKYADQLVMRGRQVEALRRFLEAWDAPRIDDEEFNEYRRTAMVSSIMGLDSPTLPARNRLEQRSQEAVERVDAGPEGIVDLVGPEAEEGVVHAELAAQAADHAAISRAIGRPDRPYELFDRVADKPWGPVVQQALVRFVLPLLGYHQRYAEVLEFVPEPEDVARKAAAKYTEQVALVEGVVPKSSLWRYRKGFARELRDSVLPVFEALVGAGHPDEARRIAAIVLDVDDDVDMYLEVIRVARRAGGQDVAAEIGERGRAQYEQNYKAVNRIKRALEKEL